MPRAASARYTPYTTRMTGTALARREFIRNSVHGCALLLAGVADPRIWTRARTQETLRIGLVAPPTDGGAASAARGVSMGVEEAARTGELMGRAIELRTVDADAERLLRDGGIAALIGVGGDESARETGAMADAAGILFVNAGARSDALRGAECRRNVFHVEASEAMYAAALAARGGDSAGATGAALWH